MGTTYLGIDIGSTKVCAIMAEKLEDGGIKILGESIQKAKVFERGSLTDIESASKVIKKVVNKVKDIAGKGYNRVIVAVPGYGAKSIDSKSNINIPHNDISIDELNRVMQVAYESAYMPSEYQKIHVLPCMFKVDEQEHVKNPLGMVGNRLEVSARVIAVQKSLLDNIKRAVNGAGLNIDNYVLSGYASSIATLTEDEKALGACVIDIGATTCNMVIHLGNSLRYNDFLDLGSFNITKDLSKRLHIPIEGAEGLKISYNKVKEAGKTEFFAPKLGDNDEQQKVSIEAVEATIGARVMEIFNFLSDKLTKSGFENRIGSIVLTGGYTKLQCVSNLANDVFPNFTVRLAKPKKIDMLPHDPSYSVALGLVMYGSGSYTPYELDSKKVMRHKEADSQESFKVAEFPKLSDKSVGAKDEMQFIAKEIPISAKNGNFFTNFWDKLFNIF